MRSREIVQTIARRPTILVVLMFAALFMTGCGSDVRCPTGLHPYHGKCLSNVAIQYVGCTADRGMNTIDKVGVGAGTFKVVADASLEIAKTENTPVAMAIVKDCLEIAKNTSPPDDPEQAIVSDYIKIWIKATPVLRLSRASGRIGQQVTVTGRQYWPGEMVNIYLQASLIAQTSTDDAGGFSMAITVPSNASLAGVPTSITAVGHSSARWAQAPFEVVG